MVLTAYYLDDKTKKVSDAQLSELGVVHWNLDPTKFENDPVLNQICKERGYSYKDFVNSTKMPNLKEKLDTFLIEHLHEDEEIRYFLEGSGYFDVRGAREEKEPWYRIHMKAGDMIVLPAGIYHRFVPDEKMFFHVMRFFCGAPVWTPFNRSEASTDEKAARKSYVKTFLSAEAKKEQSANGKKRKELDGGCGSSGCCKEGKAGASEAAGGGCCKDGGACCDDGGCEMADEGEGECCAGGSCALPAKAKATTTASASTGGCGAGTACCGGGCGAADGANKKLKA